MASHRSPFAVAQQLGSLERHKETLLGGSARSMACSLVIAGAREMAHPHNEAHGRMRSSLNAVAAPCGLMLWTAEATRRRLFARFSQLTGSILAKKNST